MNDLSGIAARLRAHLQTHPNKHERFELTRIAEQLERMAAPSEPPASIEPQQTLRLIAGSLHDPNFQRDAAMDALYRIAAELDLRASGAPSMWQPIETAPRDSRRLLVYYPSEFPDARTVFEAWWRMPYEGAPPEQCWWCYDGNKTMLSVDVHRTLDGKPIGATLWMPLPAPPSERR